MNDIETHVSKLYDKIEVDYLATEDDSDAERSLGRVLDYIEEMYEALGWTGSR